LIGKVSKGSDIAPSLAIHERPLLAHTGRLESTFSGRCGCGREGRSRGNPDIRSQIDERAARNFSTDGYFPDVEEKPLTGMRLLSPGRPNDAVGRTEASDDRL
jgi:hypothetical protein